MTPEEILNSILVKRTSDGQYGLRAQITSITSGLIQDGLPCAGVIFTMDQILNMILTNSTQDGRAAIQFFNAT